MAAVALVKACSCCRGLVLGPDGSRRRWLAFARAGRGTGEKVRQLDAPLLLRARGAWSRPWGLGRALGWGKIAGAVDQGRKAGLGSGRGVGLLLVRPAARNSGRGHAPGSGLDAMAVLPPCGWPGARGRGDPGRASVQGSGSGPGSRAGLTDRAGGGVLHLPGSWSGTWWPWPWSWPGQDCGTMVMFRVKAWNCCRGLVLGPDGSRRRWLASTRAGCGPGRGAWAVPSAGAKSRAVAQGRKAGLGSGRGVGLLLVRPAARNSGRGHAPGSGLDAMAVLPPCGWPGARGRGDPGRASVQGSGSGPGSRAGLTDRAGGGVLHLPGSWSGTWWPWPWSWPGQDCGTVAMFLVRAWSCCRGLVLGPDGSRRRWLAFTRAGRGR